MELFEEEESSDETESRIEKRQALRPADCGVLAFHLGTEAAFLNEIEQNASRGNPESILNAADNFCETKHWMMLLGPEKGSILVSALKDAMERKRPLRCLELGSYVGYGSVLMASVLRDNDSLLTLDIDPHACQWTKQLLEYANLQDCVTILNATVDALANDETDFDFVFIDHDKALYLSDLQTILTRLAPGATIVADNVLCFDNGLSMQDYLYFVRNPMGPFVSSRLHSAALEYSFGSEPDGIEVSIFGSSI